jgi:hypothetical protein
MFWKVLITQWNRTCSTTANSVSDILLWSKVSDANDRKLTSWQIHGLLSSSTWIHQVFEVWSSSLSLLAIETLLHINHKPTHCLFFWVSRDTKSAMDQSKLELKTTASLKTTVCLPCSSGISISNKEYGVLNWLKAYTLSCARLLKLMFYVPVVEDGCSLMIRKPQDTTGYPLIHQYLSASYKNAGCYKV